MEPKNLWTMKWTQPYSNNWERPYLRQLHSDFEQLVEHQLEDGDFTEAKREIERIMKL
jgi:hypothetical protein